MGRFAYKLVVDSMYHGVNWSDFKHSYATSKTSVFYYKHSALAVL